MTSHVARRWHSPGAVARGWGLGFTLVKGSVEAHGGSIRIDSAPGQGATFIIELPMDPRPFQVR
jgi:signal transduction histidine kinase